MYSYILQGTSEARRELQFCSLMLGRGGINNSVGTLHCGAGQEEQEDEELEDSLCGRISLSLSLDMKVKQPDLTVDPVKTFGPSLVELVALAATKGGRSGERWLIVGPAR